ncbi:hypothetical protein SBOR_0406 [Sclerotinia borealis F-4128]|uniref:Uncharacterized protein n=1 Tax=Sclerotinia borealis (strain F-4128) TaxID=1432307 RepID=W9CX23_SCLBF|nr:hypothetical protein SBOR_0406 [Sclerotinia borealis F-4128]
MCYTQNFEQRWQSTLTSYTLCDLTKHTDKLIADSSIAGELANTMPKRYLTGLWDVNIQYQMTWITVKGRTTLPRNRVGDADFVKAGWSRVRGSLNRVKATKTTAPSWNPWEKSTSLTDEVTGLDLIKSRKGIEQLVWVPMLVSFDNSVSCQCLYLTEVKAPDQSGDDGKFVKPGEKIYRRVGSGTFGRITNMLRQDKLLLELGTYPKIPVEAEQLDAQVMANGFQRNENGFQEFVFI